MSSPLEKYYSTQLRNITLSCLADQLEREFGLELPVSNVKANNAISLFACQKVWKTN